LATGPSVGVLWLKIQELTRQHAGLAQVNKKGQLLEWNREQILGVMVMELHKENRKLIESYMNLLRDKTHNEH
jgi:hypothetical protein